MPTSDASSIATKLLQTLGNATIIGPILVGLSKPVQIVHLNARDSEIVNAAALAAYNVGG
jgi:malate dehydrogenase (oxaloacetate-decarboxylating)(NADP+)